MKTTIQIPDSLFNEARRLANRENTTLKSLVEQGLRRIIAEHKSAEPFRLRKVGFKGRGLNPGLAEAAWEQIRDLSYEGRGG
ncbi:type II toxin-antitoxin system VapB family antitoxin [Candidatus Binatia bacterium]|nr:type II toxin-antitoxin system VapB family antitoxin [Candidatus Binatia bacterium]